MDFIITEELREALADAVFSRYIWARELGHDRTAGRMWVLLEKLRSLPTAPDVEELQNLVDTLRQEAEMQAQEMRSHKTTVAEIYQIVTDKKGEPGCWNGAEPARKAFSELRAENTRLREALEDRYSQTHCGCGHPACKRCQMDEETLKALEGK